MDVGVSVPLTTCVGKLENLENIQNMNNQC